MRLYRGGRKAGSKNKRTDLHAICEKHGVNVFEEMLLLAIEETDKSRRFNKFSQLAQFLYSKPKEELDLSKFSPEEIREYVLSLIKSDEPVAS